MARKVWFFEVLWENLDIGWGNQSSNKSPPYIFKKRVPKSRQIRKPNFGRCSSEPSKVPDCHIQPAHVKFGDYSDFFNKSPKNEHTKQVLPTPTVKLNLETSDDQKMSFTDFWTKSIETINQNKQKRLKIQNEKYGKIRENLGSFKPNTGMISKTIKPFIKILNFRVPPSYLKLYRKTKD